MSDITPDRLREIADYIPHQEGDSKARRRASDLRAAADRLEALEAERDDVLEELRDAQEIIVQHTCGKPDHDGWIAHDFSEGEYATDWLVGHGYWERNLENRYYARRKT